MNIRNFANGTRVSRLGRAGRIALALVFLQSMTLSPALWAGAFIFAGEGNGVDVIYFNLPTLIVSSNDSKERTQRLCNLRCNLKLDQA